MWLVFIDAASNNYSLVQPILFVLFYRRGPMVISKKTIIFQDSRGGDQHFPGATLLGAGVKLLIPVETYIMCDSVL